MCKVAHFEIPADEAERARMFYRSVVGWGANRWEGSSTTTSFVRMMRTKRESTAA